MNYIYFGYPADINIGNGKTVSAVKHVLEEHLLHGKTIFSNIKLYNVDYIEFRPNNISEVLETEDSIVLFDELYTILYKNHRISEGCKKHKYRGLCYHMILFFRQVRKMKITTVSTCQLWSDAHYQLRNMMQVGIVCEKYHLANNYLTKCQKDRCPEDHIHWIKNIDARTGDETMFNPEPYYGMYNSNEIVKGWDCYD